ncbi:MAG: NAD(+) synthase, partial [Muribaculaceae bacterium]|nr:NAD(+) synthase [Muribaculaceae bacterium]
ELALGWCTYNGDHMSMYAINAGVPKTLVKALVAYEAQSTDDATLSASLMDIVDTPISPELVPSQSDQRLDQVTEDIVGPYELHDFFIYNTLRYAFRPGKVYALAQIAFRGTYDSETIKRWLTVFYRRFFTQQFKRSCMPDGPKVVAVSLSPRADWRMPSDSSAALWLKECEQL